MLKFLKHVFTRKEKRRIERRALWISVAVLIGLTCAAGLVVRQADQDKARLAELQRSAQKVSSQQQTPPHSAPIGGAFTLVNQDGKTVTDATYRGKYLLVYFGYTYCPDMCSTALESIAHVLDDLGADAAKLQPLYITIDPERDTPAKLKEFIASFHTGIVGLTGTPEQINLATKAYQVYYARGEQVDEHDYVMDHSTLIYLMDPQGKFIKTFDEEVDPALLVKGLREVWAADVKPKP